MSKRLLQKALKALPQKVTLTYVARGDSLTNEQFAKVLGGEKDEVIDEFLSMSDTDTAIDGLLEDVLRDSDEQERFKRSQYFGSFREACQDRDESDPYTDLLYNMGQRMVRVYIRQNNEKVELDYDSWRWDSAKVEVECRRLAAAAGVTYEGNEEAFKDLVENATYGGQFCILYYADTKYLSDAVEHLLRNDTNCVRMTFTDPYMIIHDKVNGSGADAQIKGTITVEFSKADLNTTSGILQLDHKGAGTGYSWSDDIAGVVYRPYENSPIIEKLEAATKVVSDQT